MRSKEARRSAARGTLMPPPPAPPPLPAPPGFSAELKTVGSVEKQTRESAQEVISADTDSSSPALAAESGTLSPVNEDGLAQNAGDDAYADNKNGRRKRILDWLLRRDSESKM